MPDNSVDSIVTDPPYELGFMGKKWDSTGIAYDQTLWTECLRVLKPGGHLIAFGGTRTYHRMTVAIEDAGFEIRDCIQWNYASGFPKSLDVSKAIDKQAGATRDSGARIWQGGKRSGGIIKDDECHELTSKRIIYDSPSTDLAKQWHGFGTALKPANEPAVLARKPLSGTVADNVMTWGCGALNIDGCRVGSDIVGWQGAQGGSIDETQSQGRNYRMKSGEPRPVSGRWPANVIFDEEAAQMLDEQSGQSVSKSGGKSGSNANPMSWHESNADRPRVGHSDSGGASRFFYVAKASRAEREAGLDGMEVKKSGAMSGAEYREDRPTNHPMRANHHPTVKPITLMRYLVRLVTPPGGVVLDPFMGSGSTGCAAMLEAMQFIGIELNAEYLEIARRRIEFHEYTVREKNPMGL
jgi:site-specific DNA-methyltransferase (adenine-specific)